MAADAFALVADGDATGLAVLLDEQPELAAGRNDAGVSLLLFALYHRQPDAADAVRARLGRLDAFQAAAVGDGVELAARIAESPESAGAWAPDGFTPLHLAAFFGRRDAAALLLERGADADAVARNPMQVRPLHSAASGRHATVVSALLAHGVDVNAAQHGGWTALHASAMHGDAELTRTLLEHGADAAALADNGKTPAELAAEGGHESLAALLARGA